MKNNHSVVEKYKLKVIFASLTILMCFISIYFLQGKMWEFQDKYNNSLKDKIKLEETITNIVIRNMELEGAIEIFEQQLSFKIKKCKG